VSSYALDDAGAKHRSCTWVKHSEDYQIVTVGEMKSLVKTHALEARGLREQLGV
jgi:hypothetical protein